MRPVWLLGLILFIAMAACSGSPSSPSLTSATCSFTLGSTTLNMAGVGGTATIAVTTGSTCSWTVVSSAAFVSVTSAASVTGPGSVNVSVAENLGDARTATLTIGGQTVTVNQASGDPVFGNWAGTIAKGTGCPASLPATAQWTGTIRRNAGGFHEFVISIPSVLVFNQTVSLTLDGSTLRFAVALDALYTFTATLSADRRAFSGTFAGGTCSGTWTGTRQ